MDFICNLYESTLYHLPSLLHIARNKILEDLLYWSKAEQPVIPWVVLLELLKVLCSLSGPWAFMSWVLISNPWLDPCPLRVVPLFSLMKRRGLKEQGNEHFSIFSVHCCWITLSIQQPSYIFLVQPFISNTQVLVALMSLASLSSSWALVSLTTSLQVNAMFKNSSFVVCPCFHLPYAAFYGRALSWSGLLVSVLDFLSIKVSHSHAWRMMSLQTC